MPLRHGSLLVPAGFLLNPRRIIMSCVTGSVTRGTQDLGGNNRRLTGTSDRDCSADD